MEAMEDKMNQWSNVVTFETILVLLSVIVVNILTLRQYRQGILYETTGSV